MEDITTDLLRILCKDETIVMTQHFLYRMQERGIKYNDIKHCIMSSEILEHYPDDFPHPSCLLLGYTKNKQPLHIVIGTDKKTLWIITAYYPDNKQWENDFKTRKEDI